MPSPGCQGGLKPRTPTANNSSNPESRPGVGSPSSLCSPLPYTVCGQTEGAGSGGAASCQRDPPGPSPAWGLGASQTSQAPGHLEPSADLIIEAQPVLRSLGSKTTFHGRLPDPQPTKGASTVGNHHRTLLKSTKPTGFNSAACPSGWTVSSLRAGLGCMQPMGPGTYCTRGRGLSKGLSS